MKFLKVVNSALQVAQTCIMGYLLYFIVTKWPF